MLRYSLPLLTIACLSPGLAVHAETVTLAVASNFAGPARELVERFEANTGHRVRIATGSTGKLYAQIVSGAPFDVFMSADEEAPARLLEQKLAAAAAPYALGRLVLVSADPALEGASCLDAFLASTGATVAIANPETAPYGRAAAGFLRRYAGQSDPRVVRGDNVAQAMHFVASGNARFGLVGAAQIHARAADWPGCIATVGREQYDGIAQAAALLERAAEQPAATALFAFLSSAEARTIIAKWGYTLPLTVSRGG
ncbi:MAG: molybdate ABC transporter substrate-binding protein [Pseudomonadota bacterium]